MTFFGFQSVTQLEIAGSTTDSKEDINIFPACFAGNSGERLPVEQKNARNFVNQSINQSLFKHGKSSVKLAKKSLKKCLNTVLHDCRVGIRYVRDSI